MKTPPIQPGPKSWASGWRASGLSAILLIAVWGAAAFASAPSTVDTRFPGLASGILKSARVTDLPATVLLKADGIEINAPEIDRMLQQAQPELRLQLEKNRFFLLEQEAARRVIVREAKAAPSLPANLSDAEAVQRLFNQVAAKASVPESEARAFFDSNKHLFGSDPYDVVADTIRQVLLENKKEEAIQD